MMVGLGEKLVNSIKKLFSVVLIYMDSITDQLSLKVKRQGI